jgi:hypothetical protein
MAKYLTLLVSLAFLLGTAHGQELPSTPSQQSWAHSSRFLLPSYLLLTGADAWATERDQTQRYHYERNPLIPHTTAGRAAYFTGTAAAVIGTSYLLDRHGHRRWAKALLWGAAGVEAQAAFRSWTKK